MAQLTMAKAINEGLRRAMADDPKVLVMGEDIGKLGGVFRITDGLLDEFGAQRVVDTPLAEAGIMGTAVGLAFRGMAAARLFYGHFFASFQPLIAGYELLREWVTDEGVGQEYRIELRFPDGREESHRVIGVLTFGRDALAGERVWASERLLRLMFGPAYEQATAIR